MADIGYYQPYESGSESDTGSSSDSDESEYWSSSEEEEALITSPVSLLRTAGPAFADQKDALLNSRTNAYSSVEAAFSAPERIANVYNGINVGSTQLITQPRSVDNIVNIASQDRDYHVYSNPTEFTLHLPRVYKNVTNFDIQQIKFLNAFYYFRNDKNNTYYDFVEVGRPHRIPNSNLYSNDFYGQVTTVSTGAEQPFVQRVNIREGSYNITTLLQELQYQLNTPPIFYFYAQGFREFAPLFAESGDYGLNFNKPGTYFYDSLNNTFVTNPTTTTIIQSYFSSTNANLGNYTLEQSENAYFYPVLREVFLDPVALPDLVISSNMIDPLLQPDETIDTHVIYNFTGLNDPITLILINDNKKFLELYRTSNTYINRPINEYGFRVDTFNNRLTIYANSLQKSLVNEISTTLCNSFIKEFLSNGLDAAGRQYNALVSCNQKLLATISQMKDFVYCNMAYYFAVPYNTYTFQQLLDYNTLFVFQNGIGACNITTPVSYWDCNSNPPTAPDYNATDASPITFSSYPTSYMSSQLCNTTCNYNIINQLNSNYIYKNYQIDIDNSDQLINPNDIVLRNSELTDSNGYLNINPKKRSSEIICDIRPYEYSVYTFKSPVRQTLQIETIPVPHRFRYFSNNEQYGAFVSNYFTLSNGFSNTHPYLSNIQSSLQAISSDFITPQIQGTYQDQATGETGASEYNLNYIKKFSFFELRILNPLPISPSNYNITANLEIDTSNDASTIIAYLYADRASYLNDAYIVYKYYKNNCNLLSNLSSNYIATLNFSNNGTNYNSILSNLEYTANCNYYIIIQQRTDCNVFNPISFKSYFWCLNSNSNNIFRTLSYDSSGNPLGELTLPFYLKSPDSNTLLSNDPSIISSSSNIYTNFDYYLLYDYVYNRLPIDCNSETGPTPTSNSFNNPILDGLIPIGYDSNNVSGDLTDYKGFPFLADTYSSTVRIDPINNYLFEYLTPYNSNTQTYISYQSSNKVLDAITASNYSYSSEDLVYAEVKRRYKIVHWADQIYLPINYYDKYNYPSSNGVTTDRIQNWAFWNNKITYAIKPFIQDATILNNTPSNWDYANYTSEAGYLQAYDPYRLCNFLQLGFGLSGIGFLPTDGSWDVESFSYKSAFLNPQATSNIQDPNLDVQFIGVFDTRVITTARTQSISLCNALFILQRSNAIYYDSNVSGSNSFCNTYYDPIGQSNYDVPITVFGSNFIIDCNFGFDRNYGSYHSFFIHPSSINSNVNGRLAGYTQSYLSNIIDDRSFYSLVPFRVDSNNNIMLSTFPVICGSVTSHPEITVGKAVLTCNYGSNTLSNREVFVPDVSSNPTIPDYIPRSVYDTTGSNALNVSQYSQSMPIVTQPLQIPIRMPYISNSEPNRTYNFSNMAPVFLAYPSFSNWKISYGFLNGPTFSPNGLSDTSAASNVIFTAYPNSNSNYIQANTPVLNFNALTYARNGTYAATLGTCSNCNVIAYNYSEKDIYIMTRFYNSTNPNISNIYAYYKYTSSIGTAGKAFYATFDCNTNTNYGSNYFFTRWRKQWEFSGDLKRIYYHVRYDLTRCKMNVYNPAFSNGTYTTQAYSNDIIHLDYLPGLSNTFLNNFRVYAQNYPWPGFNLASAPLYNNSKIIFLRNEMPSFSPGTTSLYEFDPTDYIPSTSNATFKEYVFDSNVKGLVTDAKIDGEGNIYFTRNDDPYHLHMIVQGDFIDTCNVPSTNYSINRYKAETVVSAFRFPYSTYYNQINPATSNSNFSWTIGNYNRFYFNWSIPNGSNNMLFIGNKNQGTDEDWSLTSIYNCFFPNMKISLIKKDIQYNTITDVNNLIYNPFYLSNGESNATPQFGRTHAFFYSNGADFSNDLTITSGMTTYYKWGRESSNNYFKADTQEFGYNYGSYIYNITLDTTDSNETRYLAIRGEQPTENFQTVLRIVAANRVDFGFVAMSNIFREISNVYYPAGSTGASPIPVPFEQISNYNPQYAINLSNYDQNFAMSNRYFGADALTGYYGLPITTSNSNSVTSNFFYFFMSNLSNYYGIWNSNQIIIDTINSNAYSNFSNTIQYESQISYLLPQYAYTRENITDPIPYQLLFYSSIPTGRFQSLDEGWGLGWNLGFDKVDTDSNTVFQAQSFYKIFDDYIFLRLNPEQNMNRVDYTSREHLNRALDPQGTVQTYYGKLLLNTFGNYATTFIANPVEFNPPISRLDHLRIQWLDPAGNVLDNPDCEWNAVLRIIENTPTATIASTIPTLVNQPQVSQKMETKVKDLSKFMGLTGSTF